MEKPLVISPGINPSNARVFSPVVRTLAFYSIAHLDSALFHALEATDLERLNKDFNNEVCTKQRAYVIGAILSSVAFIEATINEFYADVDNRRSRFAVGTSEQAITMMGRMWCTKGFERSFSIIDKYEICLSIFELPSIRGKHECQKIADLIELRNKLVHYKPNWQGGGIENQKEDAFSERLQGHKFPLNPYLTGLGNPFFPDKCLASGCARWSVLASFQYVQLFFSEIGQKPEFESQEDLKGRIQDMAKL